MDFGLYSFCFQTRFELEYFFFYIQLEDLKLRKKHEPGSGKIFLLILNFKWHMFHFWLSCHYIVVKLTPVYF